MTLTELAYYSRRFLPISLILGIFFLILIYLIRIIFFLVASNQKPPILENPIFGKIKKPVMTNNTIPNQRLTYILDTIEGRPVTATSSAKVFFIPPVNPKLGYREKLFLMAQNFGIDPDTAQYQLSNTEAQFSDEKQKLIIDIARFNFTYEYFFENDPALFEETIIPSSKEIEALAIDFLRKISYPVKLAKGQIDLKLLYFDPVNKVFSQVDHPSKANVVEIDFYREKIDDWTLIGPKFPSSNNFLVMIFFDREYKVLRGQLKFFEEMNNEFGLYRLKTGDTAWEMLKQNQAYFINFPLNTSEIKIKNMFLAYFDPDIYQPYLQPVYVFVGEPNFTAFVPAVDEDFLEEPETPSPTPTENEDYPQGNQELPVSPQTDQSFSKEQ